MINSLLILTGKFVSIIIRYFNVGSGSTWPGHIALNLNKNFIKNVLNANKNLKTILIAGTNGKTTTGKLIQTILEKNNKKVFQNTAGANLLNGIASSLILNSNLSGKINKDFAIFEIDENTLSHFLKKIRNPDFIIILNLFRDQLDRYGEINTIAQKWKEALNKLTSKTKLILNADDPQIASLVPHRQAIPIPYRKRDSDKVFYFGLEAKKKSSKDFQHASDSTYCPNCGAKLLYKTVYYSHLGDWECKKCKNVRPKLDYNKSPIYPLPGTYNQYNAVAAVSLSRQLDIDEKIVISSLKNFTPAFGRQELLSISGKKVQIFLSKNPTGFNESLRTITDLKAKNLLLVLNDRIPDGRDVSWIWDVDTEDYIKNLSFLIVSGDRAYDMGLRIKYSSVFSISNFQFSMKTSNLKFQIEEDLKKAITLSLEKTPKSETLYVLPTYSAMLETRKILTGKSIL